MLLYFLWTHCDEPREHIRRRLLHGWLMSHETLALHDKLFKCHNKHQMHRAGKKTVSMSHKGKVSLMWILFSEVCRKEGSGESQWIASQGAALWELLRRKVVKCNKKPSDVWTQYEMWPFECVSGKTESKTVSATTRLCAATPEQNTNINKMPLKNPS